MSSQVCSAKKPMTWPAALNRKLTIAPRRPGSMEAIFLPSSFSPFPIAFPVAFKPLVRTPMAAPIVVPAARNIAVTVSYFLKKSFTLSKRGLFPSNSSSRAIILLISSSRVSILSRAASFSSGEEFLSFKILVSSSLSFSSSSLSICSFFISFSKAALFSPSFAWKTFSSSFIFA